MVCNSVMSNMYGNLNTKMMKHLDMKRRDMIKRELSQLIRERVEVSLCERSLENWPIADIMIRMHFGTQV
mgnify:CR=1 FL=1